MKKITINNALEVLCIIILLGVPSFILSIYDQIPTIIPIHYDLYGKVDGFGNKGVVWIITAIEILPYIGLSFLQRYPQKFNYPVQVTESNKDRLYSLGIRIILLMKLCIVMLFSYISLCIITVINMSMTLLVFGLIIIGIIIPLNINSKIKKSIMVNSAKFK